MTLSHSPISAQWLEDQLNTLLNSPYIHINPITGPGGVHFGGPGPIDLFSTHFNNLFAEDATGVIDGRDVDRQGIKDAILTWQGFWNSSTAKFTPRAVHAARHDEVSTCVTWTQEHTGNHDEVIATAVVKKEDENLYITFFKLEGSERLFFQ